MKKIKTYTPAYNLHIAVDLYEFDTQEEAKEYIHHNRRETCFMSDGKYYVGIRREGNGNGQTNMA